MVITLMIIVGIIYFWLIKNIVCNCVIDYYHVNNSIKMLIDTTVNIQSLDKLMRLPL